ncbi:hypothetical protein JTB14_020451 [Gonioctena quinquepunctata]|nr:hypothetical protein JTB14_020451 [Gonioctena quinquepunctata]
MNCKKKEYTLEDVMKKLHQMENNYQTLLKMYEDQVKVIQKLLDEVSNLKTQMNKLAEQRTQTGSTEEASNEWQQREEKKSNLMIYGCIENDDESNETQVRGIIKSVCPEVNLNNLKVFRVGEENSERPIKAVLPSHKEVRSVFFKAKEVIKNPQYHTIALGFDKTLKLLNTRS